MTAPALEHNVTFRWARAYAAAGWSVFPVWWPLPGGGCGCKTNDCDNPGKHPIVKGGLNAASDDEAQLAEWWEKWPRASIGINCGRSGLVVVDVDRDKGGDAGLDELRERLGEAAFPVTVTAETGGGGLHLIYRAHPEFEIRNSVRKVAAGIDIRGVGGYIVAPPSAHYSGTVYQWRKTLGPHEREPAGLTATLARALAAVSGPVTGPTIVRVAPSGNEIPLGQRDSTLTRLAGTMRRPGMGEEAIFAALMVENTARCVPPLPEAQVRKIAHSVSGYAPATVSTNGHSPTPVEAPVPAPGPPSYPAPPAECAYRGLAGEFVRLIEPHTEADPVALLGQFLVAYGNVIGRSAHFVAEADRHFTNLYLCLVGETAKGRKGSSLGQVKRLFADLVPQWVDERIQEGQSSGEGLIWAVRDPIRKRVPVMDKKRATGEYREEVVDDGVSDKRLLAAESEFASLLRMFEREGNTLSAVLRQAWDSGHLRALTKNSQAKASGAHISEIGHITADELHRYLLRTEMANGLGNRYLWLCVRRSKVLPDGGNAAAVDLSKLLYGLQQALDFGSAQGAMARDAEAGELWHAVYAELSDGQPGMYGALTARAEAQVMRLALVYALLDLADAIRRPHLEAALELWRYCADSVRYVFGGELGDPVADTIVAALRDAPDGLARGEISRLFSHNRSAEELERALVTLSARGVVSCARVKTGGRPVDRYLLLSS